MSIPNPSLHLLSRKIIFSTLVQYIGRIAQIVLAALTIKLVTNFLSVNNYGVYATISEYALFFSVAANLGIFATTVRQMSVNPTDGKTFINALYLRIITAVIIFAVGITWLLITGSSTLFIIWTAIFFWVLLLDFMTSVCDGMLQANYLMGRATLALVLGRVISLIALYLIIRYTDTTTMSDFSAVMIIFASLVAGSLAIFLLSFYFVARRIHLNWTIDRDFMWSIFRTGLLFGIINVINSLYFRFLPDYFSHLALTSAEFAIFNISFRISQIMSLLSTFLMFSALPGLREYIADKHWQKLRKLYSKIVLVLGSAGIGLIVFGSLLGPTVIKLVTNEWYLLPEFWFILPLMLVLAAISYGYDLILITLFAFDKNRWLLSRECIAISVAMIFFVASLFVDNTQLRIVLVIGGAIAGEGTMVVTWLWKIKKIMRALD